MNFGEGDSTVFLGQSLGFLPKITLRNVANLAQMVKVTLLQSLFSFLWFVSLGLPHLHLAVIECGANSNPPSDRKNMHERDVFLCWNETSLGRYSGACSEAKDGTGNNKEPPGCSISEWQKLWEMQQTQVALWRTIIPLGYCAGISNRRFQAGSA